MSSPDNGRSSLSRWCRRTKWMALVLSLLLVPHAVLSAVRDAWPESLVTIHAASAAVAVVLGVMFHLTRWLGDRTAERLMSAYDAGRATSMAAELARLEQRIDHG